MEKVGKKRVREVVDAYLGGLKNPIRFKSDAERVEVIRVLNVISDRIQLGRRNVLESPPEGTDSASPALVDEIDTVF